MATWAKGVDFKNSANTKRIGGVGVYGTDTTAQKLYLGLGTEPWNNAGLELTNSTLKFKGVDVSLNGHNHEYAGSSSSGGSANSSVKLSTARTINGTNFDGTANITTAKWGTTRTFALTGAVTGSASIDGSGNISLATTANHNHNNTHITPSTLDIPFKDTRNTNNNPEAELAKSNVKFDFRSNAACGLTDGGSYSGIMSLRMYGSGTDWSGGPAHQLAFTPAGNLHIRKSTNGTTWDSWHKFYHTGNKPTLTEIGAASASHNHSGYAASNHGHDNYVSGSGAHGVTTVANANSIWKSGFYDNGGGGSNYPTGDWNWLIHCGHISNNPNYRYGLQIAGQNSTSNFHMRTVNVNGEGSWHRLWHTGNFDPNSKANSSHSHSRLALQGNNDLINNAPWYGLGMSNIQWNGQGNVVQLGGYFGIRLRTITNIFDLSGTDQGAFLYTGHGNLRLGPKNSDWCHIETDRDKFYFNKQVQVTGDMKPYSSGSYWLGSNNPDNKWAGVCCVGGTLGNSDIHTKENIERLDGSLVSFNELDKEILEFQLEHFRKSNRAIQSDYYDFIKDRFKPSYYNYKLSDRGTKDGSEFLDVETEYNMFKNVGFIAQDYNLKTDNVAKEFIFANEEGELSYNHMSYVTVGMIALQEAIKKIEVLENEIKILKNKIEVI